MRLLGLYHTPDFCKNFVSSMTIFIDVKDKLIKEHDKH
uniref:Uncharacterized protein n=1 Tax=Anguilla anguilla TaxID=7936 RepID=A0A0E9W1E9_ANGAN